MLQLDVGLCHIGSNEPNEAIKLHEHLPRGISCPACPVQSDSATYFTGVLSYITGIFLWGYELCHPTNSQPRTITP